MKISNNLILIFVFLFSSCAHEGERELKRRNLNEYFVGSGVIRYFMTDLPPWANFSQSAGCHREFSTRFLDLKKIRASFLLNYEEAISLQHMYNVEWAKLQERSSNSTVPFKQEEALYFSLSDKIQAGVRIFTRPKFKRINLVWIDSALGSIEKEKQLIKLMKGKQMAAGHPVFVSLCLNQGGIDKFIHRLKLHSAGVRGIPMEFFSVFDSTQRMNTHFVLDFDEIFKKDQKLYLYLPTKTKPVEFKGTFKIKYY